MNRLAMLALAVFVMSCDKKESGADKKCKDAICTDMFAMMNIQVIDANKKAIVLDSYYSVNNDTKDTFRTQQPPYIDGSYVILDDSYTAKMHNKKYNFSFIGIKNNKVVVNEPFTASADCCHISRISGIDTVMVK